MTVTTFSLNGIAGVASDVTVKLAEGLPSVSIDGLTETTARVASVRVRAALTHTGFPFPAGRVAVTVAPATMRREGTGFDLPIAVAVLAASGAVSDRRLPELLIVGGLALDGAVQGVRGAIVAAELAKSEGKSAVLVAVENGQEAAIVSGIAVRTVRHLRDAVAFLNGDDTAAPIVVRNDIHDVASAMPDLREVRGQPDRKSVV